MSTHFYKNDDRIVRIEPNPFREMKLKIKMRTKKTNGGRPVVSATGKAIYVDEVPQNLTRIPGTSKRLVPVRTASGLKTGLDELVDNPYENELVYRVEWAERILKGKPKALLQHLLEYELGYEYDYLTNRVIDGIIPSNKENKTFFEKPESKPILDGGVTFLYMNNPIHRINYYTLLSHPSVAKSYADLEEGSNPDAEWFIADLEEKEKVKLTKIERETKAAAALEDLRNHESDHILHVAKALDIPEADDRSLTKTKAARIIYEYYNQNADCYANFIKVYEQWKDIPRRPLVIAASELFDYVKTGVVSYRAGKYTWVKRGQGGNASETYQRKDKQDFVNNFLLDPAYQDEVKLLEEEYQAKIR